MAAGEGKTRNVRNLGWQNFGAEKIWHHFLNTTQNLVQVPRLWQKNKHSL